MLKLTLAQARRVVDSTEVDAYASGVCLACLSLVMFPLRSGNTREATGASVSITPDLWDEGLAEYALELVGAARDRGTVGASNAFDDPIEHGGRSATARAIVLALAADLGRRAKLELALESRARDRLALAPPELN